MLLKMLSLPQAFYDTLWNLLQMLFFPGLLNIVVHIQAYRSNKTVT